MAYQVFTSDAADLMVRSYKDLKAEIVKLEGAKGAKKTIASKKQELALKGQAVQEHLAREILGVRNNFDAHTQKVDAWEGKTQEFLKLGKAAFDQYKLSHEEKDRDMATYALPTITSMVQIAEDDALEYGKAWADYRGSNFTAAGMDSEYVADFNDTVGKLMNDQKPVNVKIEKMRQYKIQAETLKKVAIRASALFAREDNEKQDDAKELADKMVELSDAMTKAAKSGITGLRQNFKTLKTAAKDPKINQKAALKNYESILTNAINIVKMYRTKSKSMEAVLVTGKRQFEGDDLKDPIVVKWLKEADETLEGTKAIVVEVNAGLVQATKDVAALRQKCVK